MARHPDDRHAGPIMELILLVFTGIGCLVLVAAVPLVYLEARRDERSRRVDR